MQKKIIYFLIVVAFLLIILNLYVESNSSVNEVPIKQEVFTSQIDSLFISTLFKNGIIEEWVEAKSISNKRHDSLRHVFYVDVPEDLQIVSILSDVTKSFNKLPVEIISEERINYSKSALKIYSNNVLKFEAFLTPNPNIEREFAEISFLADATQLTVKEVKDLTQKITIPFTLLITPSEEINKSLSDNELNINSYSVHISDLIEEKQFKLSPESSRELLASTINNLISSFSNAKFFLIDKESDIYNSVAYSYVREKLAESNKVFIEKSRYIDLTDKTFNQIVSIFEFHCENGKSKQRRVLLLNLEDLIKLKPEIFKQRKTGNKFVQM
jgi:hypothetical protein